MSQEESTLSRKDKKALRDAERAQQKGKKRKHKEVSEPDALPQQDDDANNDAPERAVEPTTSKSSSKKRKAGELFSDTTADPTLAPGPANDTVEPATASSTQPPKKKRQKTKKPTTASTSDGTVEAPTKKSRFIVFVGNLPYKTTDSSLQKHFSKLQPFTLRHRTDPKTKKSKGFAFLEFENYDRMKTCLKVFHHSLFDPEAIDRGEVVPDPTAPEKEDESGMHPDRRNGGAGKGKGKKDTARRINVELTAGGGGGKSGERKERIREKNVRLNEQRERRAELEKKEKAKKERQEGGKEKGGKERKEKKVESGGETIAAPVADGDIHPARLAMMGR
ncbi:hypothetical protein CKM354_000223400 [Cercospora kikuchii]|uniref:RRM domain-containing protein n=1 Tax=Cercospora kikuchii TaxID=84275 RepID=A0A9P3CHR7_9PEZI|nr:uncharacterized protein CKM354_000223400 [Cercospora kikuchii]GIZ38833.1 hypothetical protein CKM354_000223400 [Cercospora kikuchii]